MPRTRFWAKPWTNGLGRARGERTRTGGTVYNLNVDVDSPDQRESVIVPMDLVKQAIEKADYIGAMNKCLCREANNCTHYPHDLACLFLSKSGRVVVQHGIARKVTKEEALARVDRAAELGLACMSLWVELEQLVWGLRKFSAVYLGDGVPIVPLMPKRKSYCHRIWADSSAAKLRSKNSAQRSCLQPARP